MFKPNQYNVIKYNFGTQCRMKKCKITKKKLLYKQLQCTLHIAHNCTHCETPLKAVRCGSGIQPSSYSKCVGGYCPAPNMPEVKLIT